MLEQDEFENWIDASHTFFEIFEGRYDAYPLARKWVQEWLSTKAFTFEEKDKAIIDGLIQDFDYSIFRNFKDPIEKDEGKWKTLVNKVDQQFRSFVRNNLTSGKSKDVGIAVAPFLFTWNFQRFKEYFKKKQNFDLEHYFKELGSFLESKRNEIEVFKDRRLISEQIESNKTRGIFEEINARLRALGIRMNEPVGTSKLLHIFAPFYFPLIDNSEARAVRLTGFRESLTKNHYLTWMTALRNWLQKYLETIGKLENKHNSSIIKLVDEGLYIMCTVTLRSRVKELGIKLG